MQIFLQHFIEFIQKFGIIGLSALSFAESSFFPIPPDVVLLPMMFFNPKLSFVYAFITTATSVLGGILGYFIGKKLGRPILYKIFKKEKINKVEFYFKNYGGWAVAIAGFTPIPYKIFTISAGVFNVPISVFTIASIIGRGLRFFIEAFLVYFLGDTAKYLLTNYFEVITVVISLLLFIFYLIFKQVKNNRISKTTKNNIKRIYLNTYDFFLKYKTIDKITFYYLTGILLSLFSLMFIFELIEDFSFNVFYRIDNYIFDNLMKIRNPILNLIMETITRTGDYYFVIIITIIIIVVLYKNRKKALTFFFGINILIVWLFNEALKAIFQRPRPDFSRLISQSGYSFPSGHAMIFLTWSLLYILLVNDSFNYRKKRCINICIILYSLLVGLSRVYLGVHYFSDVLAGWLVAIIYSFSAYLVYNKIVK
ncbi:Undecaprenyl-diphosphatase BcrC [Caloramator mitchellensis]|uniref:Undecaprenyl-diphosphatase BcrC n=1 Tax=Caloramator mitchellensis TaxID=908809 RepID=A0A0R3JRA2_CALMK|nr:phosphatase PAP2 family protein [Caloramator mitchellensis]KRQ86003.1 Undecaprenyl-diphosphatase BcrC [Caloramator mitchellensis]